jgi:hypothetical protein
MKIRFSGKLVATVLVVAATVPLLIFRLRSNNDRDGNLKGVSYANVTYPQPMRKELGAVLILPLWVAGQPELSQQPIELTNAEFVGINGKIRFDEPPESLGGVVCAVFRDESTLAGANMAELKQSGEFATFKMDVPAPSKPGRYRVILQWSASDKPLVTFYSGEMTVSAVP